MFFLSSIFWIIFFNIFYKKNNSLLSLVILFGLCLNPFFINFIHFSWQQSLAFSVFLIFFSLNLKNLFLYLGAFISTLLHFGILPTALITILFNNLKNKFLFYLVFAGLTIFGIFFNLFFPISTSLIPDFFPYYERLTLSFNGESFENGKINNFEGKFILKYFLISFLTIILIVICKALNVLDSKNQNKIYSIILGGSFPMFLLASVPTANRMSYFFIIIFMIFFPLLIKKNICQFIKRKLADSISIIFVIVGHAVIIMYFYLK